MHVCPGSQSAFFKHSTQSEAAASQIFRPFGAFAQSRLFVHVMRGWHFPARHVAMPSQSRSRRQSTQ
jgi:hypothetical protein